MSSELTNPTHALVEKLTREYLDKMMEHVDTAHVFINITPANNGAGAEIYTVGRGNWYMRFGTITVWQQSQAFHTIQPDDL